MPIRVLLVEDHALVAETLATALGKHRDFEVVAVASSAAVGKKEALEHKPDVALIDINLPDYDGIELAKQLRSELSSTKLVILTGNTDLSLFPRAMAAGASGYLIKDSSLREVMDALRRANDGQVVVPESLVGRLSTGALPGKGLGSDLTKREVEVLRLIGEGTDLRVVARSLGISWHTARSYVKNILVKLDAHSQLEAVAKATKLGILDSSNS